MLKEKSMYQRGFILSFWVALSSYSYASIEEVADIQQEERVISSTENTSNVTQVTLEELEEITILPLEVNLKAQQQILNFFKDRYDRGLFITLKREENLIGKLQLQDWTTYFSNYNPIFSTLCVVKATNDPKWAIPEVIYQHTCTQAEQGDLSALCNLGFMYLNGIKVEKDTIKSKNYFNRAAQGGFTHAQWSLGLKLLLGNNFEKDEERAVQLISLGAQKGHIASQWHLGAYYAKKGDGKQSILWHEKAALEGHVSAQHELGNFYAEGMFVEKDYKKALYWFIAAANQGCSQAQYNAACVLHAADNIEKDYNQAFYWATLSAKQNYKEVYYLLAFMYEMGRGTEQKTDLAFHYYKLAAKNGDNFSQNKLANFYACGLDGINENWDKALKWTIRAAQGGFAKSQNTLKHILKRTDKPALEGKAYCKDIEVFNENLKTIYGLHLLETLFNDPQGTSQSSFKESGLAIPALYKHYKIITDYEEKVIKVIESLNHPGLLIDSRSITDIIKDKPRGKKHFYDEFKVDDHNYLALGKGSVEKARMLAEIIKGDSEELKAVADSIDILRKVFRKSYKLLLKEANVLPVEGKEGDYIAPQDIKKLHALDEHLQYIEEVANISQNLRSLIHQGASQRNYIFEEEYTFLRDDK
jgi:TPR repeat protein